MSGKLVGIIILLCAAIAGGSLYYLQIYGFYDDVVATPGQDVMLVEQGSKANLAIAYTEFQAIDADSSPIRYRACFTTSLDPATLAQTHVVIPDAVPRNAPRWFDCFDAKALADQLAAGTATAFLGTKNIGFGVDRIVAITDDGRGYAWHELNACGNKAYDGTVVGEECPPRPEVAE